MNVQKWHSFLELAITQLKKLVFHVKSCFYKDKTFLKISHNVNKDMF